MNLKFKLNDMKKLLSKVKNIKKKENVKKLSN